MSSPALGRWLPVVAWAGLISLFSTGWFTGERTGQVFLPFLALLLPWADTAQLHAVHGGLRKVGHFLEYLVLSVLLYRALRTGSGWDARAAGLAVLLAGLYSVSDEFHQWFVPGRTAAAGDCLVDVTGAAAGQGLVRAWRGHRSVAR